jgi:hypothetical protein
MAKLFFAISSPIVVIMSMVDSFPVGLLQWTHLGTSMSLAAAVHHITVIGILEYPPIVPMRAEIALAQIQMPDASQPPLLFAGRFDPEY